MVAMNIRRFTFGVPILAALLALPATVAAQSTIVSIPFDRSGPQGTMIVDTLDPMTGQPVQMLVDTGAFSNPCTLEFVDVIGVSNVSTLIAVDKFGTQKVNVSVNTKGSGRGWIGDPLAPTFTLSTYDFSESQQFVFRLPAVGEEFASDFSDKLAMRGAKSIDNWTVRAHFRIKVSSDGKVLLNLMRLTGDQCKG